MTSKVLMLSALALLAGCSESNKDESEKPGTTDGNQAPIVSVDNAIGIEKSTISINATAQDSDGSISSYSWKQTSGTSASLAADGAHLSVSLPAVTAQESLTFEVTVTDDDNASTTKSFAVLVEPILVATTLSANVDSLVGSASKYAVWIELGEQTIETTTNELGAYALTIEVDDSLATEAFTMYAAKGDKNSVVKFASVVPSVNMLNELASDTNLVSANELAALNISPVTTAKLALISQDSDTTPTSYSDYQVAVDELALDDIMSLTIATSLIYTAIDQNNADVVSALPQSFTNTLDTLSNPDQTKALLEELQTIGNGAHWKETQSALAENMEEAIAFADIKSGLIFNNKQLMFNEGGTGHWYSWNSNGGFNWEITGGNVNIEFDDEAQIEEYNADIENYVYLTGASVSALSRHAGKLYVATQAQYKDRYDSMSTGSMPMSYQSATLEAGLTRPDAALQANLDYLIEFASTVDRTINGHVQSGSFYNDLKTMTLTLSTENPTKGVASIVEKALEQRQLKQNVLNMNWSSADTHFTLESDEQLINLYIYDYDKESNRYWVSSIAQNKGDGDVNVAWERGFLMAKPANQLLSTNDVAGKVFMYEPYQGDSVATRQWYEFNADGTMAYVSTNDADNNGIIEENTSDRVRASAGLWKIENGKLEVLRHRQNADFGNSYTCLGGSWSPTLDDHCVAYARLSLQKLSSSTSERTIFDSTFSFFEDAWLRNSGFGDEAAFSLFHASISLREFINLESRPVVISNTVFDEAAVQQSKPQASQKQLGVEAR